MQGWPAALAWLQVAVHLLSCQPVRCTLRQCDWLRQRQRRRWQNTAWTSQLRPTMPTCNHRKAPVGRSYHMDLWNDERCLPEGVEVLELREADLGWPRTE